MAAKKERMLRSRMMLTDSYNTSKLNNVQSCRLKENTSVFLAIVKLYRKANEICV